MTKDPVCEMDIVTDNAVATAEYEGETYHFCSSACHEKFIAEPEKYLS